ncbi:hypothetical protein C9H16_25380, partial [Salmonella enterica]|nr:hypothetical protein [Salmonella enterica]
MATGSATAVLVLLVPLLTGGVRAQTAPATVQESGNVALVAEETVLPESSVPQTSVT